MDVKGKNVFITGSTRGIGLAIAKAFAQMGANIVLNGRNPISKDLLEEFSSFPGKIVAISGDVSDFNDAKTMVEKASQELGDIDILVNNAGITNDKIVLRMSDTDFENVLKVNLTGAFNMTQSVLKPMMKKRQGAIINVSSVVGMTGNVGQANYAASKAGLIGFTKSLAREIAGRGICANVVAPGFISSDMTDVLSDKMQDAILSQIPLKRIGQAEEVANLVTFLASQDYITGQVIAIDGGVTMQ